jgi:signal transduction histidine kinase
VSDGGAIRPAAVLDALVRITRTIGAGHSLEAIFDAVADEVALLLPYDRCSVALLDPSGETVTVSSHRGRLREPFFEGERPLAGTLAGLAIERGGPLLYALGPEDRYADDDARRRVGIRQQALVPLFVDDVPVGVFGIGSVRPDAYREEDFGLLRTVADHLALAIAATNLRRDAERRATRAQFLAGTAASFAASLDLDTTLREAVLRAADVLGDLNVIFLRDEERGDLRLRELSHPDAARERLARELAAAWPPSPSGPALGPPLRGEPHLIAKVTPERVSAAWRPFIDRMGVQSIVAVPLLAGGRIGGALVSCWTDRPAKTGRGRRPPGTDELALARDLAVQMAGAIENARLYAAAQRAIAQRDEFLSVAAHELRTPLTTLKGRAQLLQRRLGGRLGDGDRQSLAVILRQLDRLGRMVNDLLDLSRIDAGRLILVREPCDLVALARTAATEYHTPEYPIEIVAEVETVIGRWDPWRLEQVLANLLSNAVRYSRPGQPIAIRVRREGQEALLSVVDRGVGVEAMEQERIFERFYRSSRSGRAGFGLGLAICRRIVADHGGRLWAESDGLGHGSTFTMALPLDARAAASDAVSLPDAPADGEDASP